MLHQDNPQLSFMLTEKEDFYTLNPGITIKGKAVKPKDYEHSFMLLRQRDKDEFYLLPSLTDVALLEYFKDTTMGITIFKQQFKAFREGFLKALSERYPCLYLSSNKETAAIKKIQLKPVQKIVRMHTFEKWILIYLFIEYDDGSKINALLNGTGWLTERNNRQVFLQRDKQYETAFKKYVQGLHTDFSNQLPADCFYLSLPAYVKDNWLNEVQAKLTDCKVEHKVGK